MNVNASSRPILTTANPSAIERIFERTSQDSPALALLDRAKVGRREFWNLKWTIADAGWFDSATKRRIAKFGQSTAPPNQIVRRITTNNVAVVEGNRDWLGNDRGGRGRKLDLT